MIVGAAIIPTAPLLVPGVSATLPEGVQPVRDAVAATLASLPGADAAVLVGTGEPGLHASAEASLAGVGRPDLARRGRLCRTVLDDLAAATGCALREGRPLPLSLSVLAMLLAGAAPAAPAVAGDQAARPAAAAPIAPLAVDPSADFDFLAGIGRRLAEALNGPRRAVVLAAGDLSAGLTEHSPLYRVDGAAGWDERAVTIVDSGRLDALARLGPAAAAHVAALGWAPMALLHGALARARLGLVVRHYSAPRGVGYLVAQGA